MLPLYIHWKVEPLLGFGIAVGDMSFYLRSMVPKLYISKEFIILLLMQSPDLSQGYQSLLDDIHERLVPLHHKP